MAKKILAAVLAVVVAISAMAVSAFAEDARIELKPVNGENIWGTLNPTNPVASDIVVNMTFDIPVYALYGLLGSDAYFDFTLPASLTGFDNNGNTSVKTIDWSLVVNGTEYTLRQVNETTNHEITKPDAEAGKPTPNCPNGFTEKLDSGDVVSHHRVRVGQLVHGYNYVTDDTIIPNSTAYGDTTAIRLVGTVTLNASSYGYNQWSFGFGAGDFSATGKWANIGKLQGYAADGTELLNNVTFIYLWNPQVTYGNTNEYTTFVFTQPDWTTDALARDGDLQVSYPNSLAWDHTMKNRSIIYGSTSDTVKLVIELDNPIVGGATYTLWARNDQGFNAINWWQYNTSRTYIAEVTVAGKADKLEFDVPIDALLNSEYGSSVNGYNQEFVIFENITLHNNALMNANDYIHYNAKWGYDNPTIDLNVYSGNWVGNFWVGWSDKVEYRTGTGNDDHAQLRYADGGITSMPQVDLDRDGTLEDNPSYANTAAGDLTPARATAAYLLVPQEDTQEVENPTQGTDNAEETENIDDTETPEVDVTEPEPEAPAESENPGTGIALAVVPMIIAAAAAVISKKH